MPGVNWHVYIVPVGVSGVCVSDPAREGRPVQGGPTLYPELPGKVWATRDPELE